MYVINHPCLYNAFLMFSNSLKMIKINRNMPEFWQTVWRKKHDFNVTATVGFIVCILFSNMSHFLKLFKDWDWPELHLKTQSVPRSKHSGSVIQGGAKRTHVFEIGNSRESKGRRPSFSGVTSSQKSTFENLVQSTIWNFPFAKKLQLCHKKC